MSERTTAEAPPWHSHPRWPLAPGDDPGAVPETVAPGELLGRHLTDLSDLEKQADALAADFARAAQLYEQNELTQYRVLCHEIKVELTESAAEWNRLHASLRLLLTGHPEATRMVEALRQGPFVR